MLRYKIAGIIVALVFGIVGPTGCSYADRSPGLPISQGTALSIPAKHSYINASAVAAGPLIYVSELSCDCILIYPERGRNQQPVGQINPPTPAFNMKVDKTGNLWVASTGQAFEYKRGQTTPARVLNDPGYIGSDIAVSDGVVYISNNTGVPPTGGPGNVLIYANGSNNPTQTLQFPSSLKANGFGLVVDSQHNIFEAGFSQSTNSTFISEFSFKTNGTYSFARLNPNATVAALALDRSGNLALAAQADPSVSIYSAQRGKKYWKRIGSFGGASGATGISLSAGGRRAFVAYINGHVVIEYDYPSGREANEIISGLINPAHVAVSQ